MPGGRCHLLRRDVVTLRGALASAELCLESCIVLTYLLDLEVHHRLELVQRLFHGRELLAQLIVLGARQHDERSSTVLFVCQEVQHRTLVLLAATGPARPGRRAGTSPATDVTLHHALNDVLYTVQVS